MTRFIHVSCRVENDADLINIQTANQKLECQVSLKMLFLHFHLNFIPIDLSTIQCSTKNYPREKQNIKFGQTKIQ